MEQGSLTVRIGADKVRRRLRKKYAKNTDSPVSVVSNSRAFMLRRSIRSIARGIRLPVYCHDFEHLLVVHNLYCSSASFQHGW